MRQPAVTPLAQNAILVELLSRVGCHVYTGQISPAGTYHALYTGPGVDLLLGGQPPGDTSASDAWNGAVHPDDAHRYRTISSSDGPDVVQLEYRLIGYDGVTRWVLDQMWQREVLADGTRIVDGVVTDITSRKGVELQVQRLAYQDSLTGLANRLRLADRIDQAVSSLLRSSDGLALLLLDLDGFKAVNDSFGHATGDELLLAAAGRLQHCLRDHDLACRLGGDEFALLLADVDIDEAMQVGQRVLDALTKPFGLMRASVTVSASIGLVHATTSRSSENLLRDADVAMYCAKAAGKNRIVQFAPVMHDQVLQRLELESELRRAVEQREFVVYHQPLVDLHTRAILGTEALVRWRHPERGLLLPGDFIGVAEDTGLVVPIGELVLERACADAARWQPKGRPTPVSVNFSPRQVHAPDLVATVKQALDNSGLSPEALVVEITENLLLRDAEGAIARLAALRKLGIRVALDDFGTGYSSLAYLARYPVDLLKIDKSFVERLGSDDRSAALVRSVIDLAAALGLDTIAEGIENEAQANSLRSLGGRLAQGFLFARPAPADEVERMLRPTAVAVG